MAADHNPGLAIEGIVVNQFDARARLPQRLIVWDALAAGADAQPARRTG